MARFDASGVAARQVAWPTVWLRMSLCLALVVTAAACASQEPDVPEEQIVLTPTADPAHSQTVSWRTDVTSPTVEFAPRDDPENMMRVEGTHIDGQDGDEDAANATVTDLEPDTDYQYRVSSADDEFSDWHYFTTASAEPDPFTFLYFGDIQTDIATEAAPVVQAGLEAHPDAELVVHAGDLVDDATSTTQWQEWYEAFGTETLSGTNQVAAVGNHEYDDDLSFFWRARFPTAGNGPDSGADLSETVHYTDYQGVRFVTLNSNYREAPGDDVETDWLEEQNAWLDSVLADNPHDWTVVTFHHPVFPNRPDADNAPLREAWLETLEEHDVDLVLQGHDHSYGRGTTTATDGSDDHTGPVYVVAVAGSKMYEVGEDLWSDNDAEAQVQRADTRTFQAVTVEDDTLEFSARTQEGAVVDEFEIVRDGEDNHVQGND